MNQTKQPMPSQQTIRVFAPATVANVGSGFDIMGFAIAGTGDHIEAQLNNHHSIRLYDHTGLGLPLSPQENVSGVSVQAMLEDMGSTQGLDIHFRKKIPPGSGIGSSAASSAGAVYAANELLGRPFSTKELVYFAMQGEALASGSAHADNVAPALLGGFVLVRSYQPLDLIQIDVPAELWCALVHPDIEVRTQDSRMILQKEIALKTATTQWGNVAGLVAGLMKSDYGLIGRSLQDVVIEPVRSMLIPGFDLAKAAAIKAGALGCSISGSGPSLFSLANGKENATKAARALSHVFEEMGIGQSTYVSKISTAGCHTVS